MESSRFEIRLSGSGGQGIILAAVILAEAAGVYEGKYVCQTQSYGPEARGGASKSEVVISDGPIDYPKSLTPDVLLSMNQESCDTYFRSLKDDGLLIIDSTLVEQVPTERAIMIPFTRIARDKIGNEMAANMVALGAISVLVDMVSQKSIEKSLKKRLPEKVYDINLKALRAGAKAARDFDVNLLPERVNHVDDEDV